mmetsp:Transcript_12569/g.21157  ORF Transcript_12569/g.21157 Transcript_12569/m.21157 type:complete len:177 (+) Transcript_12569:128-658(+)
MAGLGVCLFSLVNAIGILILDRKAEKERNQASKTEKKSGKPFNLNDLKHFDSRFWHLTASCTVTYMTILPFIAVSSELFQQKYGFSKVEAGSLFSIPFIISTFSSPFLGYMVDRVGMRSPLILISSLFLILSFTLSMMVPACDRCLNQVAPQILLGVGFSLYASVMWASIPLTVPQ